jgi:hypothetical protein
MQSASLEAMHVLDLLLDPDVGPLVREPLDVRSTVAVALTSKALYAPQRVQLHEWRRLAWDMLKWETLMDRAPLKLVQWCQQWCYWKVQSAGRCYRWGTVDWPKKGGAVPEDLMCMAAAWGRLDVLAWLATQGGRLNEPLCARAAAHGHVRVLEWLRAQSPPCPWDTTTCHWAARHGQLEALQWARAHGAPWNEAPFFSAAAGGHIDVMRWLREQGCPWDPCTCAGAACYGQLDALQWAHKHGAPWDDMVFSGAVMSGFLDILQFLVDAGCPRAEAVRQVAVGKHGAGSDVVAWLDARGID